MKSDGVGLVFRLLDLFQSSKIKARERDTKKICVNL